MTRTMTLNGAAGAADLDRAVPLAMPAILPPVDDRHSPRDATRHGTLPLA